MRKIIKKMLQLLPDSAYISLKYFYHFKKFPNLRAPKTFNEKLQWLKLHDRRPIYQTMVDKYEAKKYIAQRIGETYVIPNYGVWDRFDDIDFDALPEQFVLKTTHDCGGVVVCRDKKSFNREEAKRFLEKHLAANYFHEGREWPYKDVKPRIIAEQYLRDEHTSALWDYKVFAFDGAAKLMFVAIDRDKGSRDLKFDFYDMDFNRLQIRNGHDNSDIQISRPENLSLMRKIAQELSAGFPHVRVDFYEVDGRLYVGELTLYHFSGLVPFEPAQWDLRLGEWIMLPVL